MPDDEVPPQPAMQRDFEREMIEAVARTTPAAAPVDAGNDKTIIQPLDADEGPSDLEEVVQSVTGTVAEKALAELDGTDRLLFPVKSKVRPSLEPILARHAARLSQIRNRALPAGPRPEDGDEIRLLGATDGLRSDDPKRKALDAIQRRIRARGTLTSDGARVEIQDADAERDAAIQDQVETWRQQLDAVEARCGHVIAEGTVQATDDDRRSAVLLVHELAATNPRHGLPILKWAIRDAALAPENRPALAAALPGLAGLYENERSAYGGSVQLRQLIDQATSLLQSAEVAVAAARIERTERTRWEIDEFIKNALAGGTEALDSEGRPVLLPPEPEPRPVPMRESSEPPPVRRASSVRREADEQRRAAWRKEQEES